MDASRLPRALTLSLAQSPKVSLVDGAVKALDVQGGRVTGVRLEDGRALGAAQVVLAMGVGTQAVLDELPELARRIPRIFSGGGTSLLLQVPRPSLQHVVRTPNRAFACGLHGMPRGGDQLYFGATNILMTRPMLRTTPADMYFLLEQIDQDRRAGGGGVRHAPGAPVHRGQQSRGEGALLPQRLRGGPQGLGVKRAQARGAQRLSATVRFCRAVTASITFSGGTTPSRPSSTAVDSPSATTLPRERNWWVA